MLIHKKIRHQVSDMLKNSIKGVENIYSGRPLFIDIDQEKTAIAVFLDEISCEEVDSLSSRIYRSIKYRNLSENCFRRRRIR